MKNLLFQGVLILSSFVMLSAPLAAQERESIPLKEISFANSRVAGKILQIDFDTGNKEHIIMYVKWAPKKQEDLIMDASTIAMIVSQNFPDVSTLSLCAVSVGEKPSNAMLINWNGIIDREAMQRINGQRIKDYGSKLYRRLFIEKKCIRG